MATKKTNKGVKKTSKATSFKTNADAVSKKALKTRAQKMASIVPIKDRYPKKEDLEPIKDRYPKKSWDELTPIKDATPKRRKSKVVENLIVKGESRETARVMANARTKKKKKLVPNKASFPKKPD